MKDWINDKYRSRLSGKHFFVTMGETCRKLSVETVSNVKDLRCSQEEADTRMFLHAKHCARSGITAVVIISDDTDVASQLPSSFFIKSGTKTHPDYVGVNKTADVLGQDY